VIGAHLGDGCRYSEVDVVGVVGILVRAWWFGNGNGAVVLQESDWLV
jgi:hypothetical protein